MNPSAAERVRPPISNLRRRKSRFAPDPEIGDQTLTYTLTASNLGPDSASLVTLSQKRSQYG